MYLKTQNAPNGSPLLNLSRIYFMHLSITINDCKNTSVHQKSISNNEYRRVYVRP